jgi:hypothetical protein
MLMLLVIWWPNGWFTKSFDAWKLDTPTNLLGDIDRHVVSFIVEIQNPRMTGNKTNGQFNKCGASMRTGKYRSWVYKMDWQIILLCFWNHVVDI